MSRKQYFDYIENALSTLEVSVRNRGKLNLLDLNIHSEIFFANLFNTIFNYNLINANMIKQNQEGIDLIDKNNKVIIQVSSTCNKTKIQNSLHKSKNYEGYSFKFIAIASCDVTKIKNHCFKKGLLNFNPEKDIYEISEILRVIQNLEIDLLEKVYHLIEKELGVEVDIYKIDTNLAKVVGILSKVNLRLVEESKRNNVFEIEEKIEFNNLKEVKDTIQDYAIYSAKLNNIYEEFDKEGINASLSILAEIKNAYVKCKNKYKNSPVEIFDNICLSVKQFVINSKNYQKIQEEELNYCIRIIIVDAFLKCKIFENPGGQQ